MAIEMLTLSPIERQPEKLSEGKFVNINQESSCEEKDKDVLKKPTL